MKVTHFAMIAAACGLLASALNGPPARAASNEPLAALSVVQNQAGPAATHVLDHLAVAAANGRSSRGLSASTESNSVDLPGTTRGSIRLSGADADAALAVSLPLGSIGAEAAVLAPGIVGYDNGNGSTTVPLIKDDGGVQITTVVESASAPSRYDFTVKGANADNLLVQDDHSVLITTPQGALRGGFLPPWARDASGHDIPTHYELHADVITQSIDLSSPTIAYPVVASRTVGYTLLAGVWKNRAGGYKYKGGDQWSTRLSTWGAFVYGSGLAGNTTIRVQGWREWVNGPGPTSTTVHQQFDCHVTFGYAVWLGGLWWDFETARATRSNWLASPQKCNWA